MECFWDAPFMKYEFIHCAVLVSIKLFVMLCVSICIIWEEERAHSTVFWYRTASLVEMWYFVLFFQFQTLIKPRELNRVPQEVRECLQSHSTAIFSLEEYNDIDFNVHSCVYCGNPKCIGNDSSIDCESKGESSFNPSSLRNNLGKNYEQDVEKLDDAIKNYDTDEGRQTLYQQTKLVDSALIESYNRIRSYTFYNTYLQGMSNEFCP